MKLPQIPAFASLLAAVATWSIYSTVAMLVAWLDKALGIMNGANVAPAVYSTNSLFVWARYMKFWPSYYAASPAGFQSPDFSRVTKSLIQRVIAS